jgi:hypothetical protein
VLTLRGVHPHWGAGRLHAQLLLLHPRDAPPATCTIRRWLRQAGHSHRQAEPLPPLPPRATQAHQTWQMDASEEIPLRDRRRVSWLRVVDEASGAFLFSRVFERGCFAEVGGPAVQAAVRAAFARWGRPFGLRVDNGSPWVNAQGTLPGELELWLAGLEVPLHRNPPGRPQANGTVERGQRTGRAWAEPELCETPGQLQARLDEEDRVQREVFVAEGGQTRLQAWPGLRHSGRAYALGSWESVCWDLGAALRCLEGYVVTRKVDSGGGVSLYDRAHHVAERYAGQLVQVRFAAEGCLWVFEQGGAEVGSSPARQISAASILGWAVSGRRGRSARRTQARRAARAAVGARGAKGEAAAGGEGSG